MLSYFSGSLPIIICMCLFLVLTFTVFVAAQDLLGISQLALLLQIDFFLWKYVGQSLHFSILFIEVLMVVKPKLHYYYNWIFFTMAYYILVKKGL